MSTTACLLIAVAENYPQLKASENFRQLQSGLDDLENKIAAACRFKAAACETPKVSFGS